MNSMLYIGVIIFAIGLFTWLFGTSRLRAIKNSLAPVQASKIRSSQIIGWIGAVMLICGIVLTVLAYFGVCTC